MQAFETYLIDVFEKYLKKSQEIGGAVFEHANLLKDCFYALKLFLIFSTQNQKPCESELINLIKPVSSAVLKVSEYKCNDKKWENHISAIANSVSALGWITEKSPIPYIKAFSEAGQFYTNRILIEYKDKEMIQCDWVKTVHNIWIGLEEYVKTHHRCGVEFENSQSKKPTENLFSVLNVGSNITKGLKKVDKAQMTHKNPNLRESSVVPNNSSSAKKNISNQEKDAHPPIFEHIPGKKYIFEYFQDDHSLKIEDPDIRENIAVFKCVNCVIQVGKKCNNVVLNSCNKVSILVDTIVACIELNNCQSCEIQINNVAPIITLDNVNGCQIYLSKESMNTEIISSKTSEINVNVPGKVETDDPIEFSLPEQYKSYWDSKKNKFVTESIAHA